MQIPLANDVVAVEHRASFVAGDRHGYPFGHSRADQVADAGSPLVMEQPGGFVGFFERLTPPNRRGTGPVCPVV